MPPSAVDVDVPAATENTPLVVNGDIEEGLLPEELKPIQEGSLLETIVGIFAAITFLSSALAVLLYNGIFVTISGIFGVFLSPFAAFQQVKMTQTIAMKETNAFFQRQLDILMKNNENLARQVGEMTQSVTNLKQMEKALGTVQAMSGNCLQQLEEQVKKQRNIKAMLKTNVKNELVNTLFEIALNCDTNEDQSLSDQEVNMLMEKLEGIEGVDVREAKLRQMVADHGRNIMSLINVAKNALRDDIPEDKLFVYVN